MARRSLPSLAALVLTLAAWESCAFLRPYVPTLGTRPERPVEHGRDAPMPSPGRIGLQPQQAMTLGQTLAASCLGPTLLGLWRSEYGVSYGYGGAVALSAYYLWRSADGLASLHLLCLILYGARLSVFLLWRELCIPRFREMRDRIEQRAGGRLSRLPFILTCALLYLGLVAPGVLVLKASARGAHFGGGFRLALLGMYVGWGIAALGDFYKSIIKAQKGQDVLVTSGPFAVLRHPNYTGEQLLWTANFVAGLLAAATLKPKRRLPDPKGILWLWVPLSVLGFLGIIFVLMQATAGLEKRQREKYGQDDQYNRWCQKSWPGLAFRSSTVAPD